MRFSRRDLPEFAAVGNTNAVALDATFKFSQLGLRCMASTISETSIGFALTLRPGDVIVLISNSARRASGDLLSLLMTTTVAPQL